MAKGKDMIKRIYRSTDDVLTQIANKRNRGKAIRSKGFVHDIQLIDEAVRGLLEKETNS